MNHPSCLAPDPLLRAFFSNYTAILPSTSLPGISPMQLSGVPIPLEFMTPIALRASCAHALATPILASRRTHGCLLNNGGFSAYSIHGMREKPNSRQNLIDIHPDIF
jgi:hypothetical protein